MTLAAEQARFGRLSTGVVRRDREPRKHITALRRRQKLSRQRSAHDRGVAQVSSFSQSSCLRQCQPFENDGCSGACTSRRSEDQRNKGYSFNLPNTLFVGIPFQPFLTAVERWEMCMSVGVCTRVENPNIKHGAFLPALPKSPRLNVQVGLVGGDCRRSIEYFPSDLLQLWFSANVKENTRNQTSTSQTASLVKHS